MDRNPPLSKQEAYSIAAVIEAQATSPRRRALQRRKRLAVWDGDSIRLSNPQQCLNARGHPRSMPLAGRSRDLRNLDMRPSQPSIIDSKPPGGVS